MNLSLIFMYNVVWLNVCNCPYIYVEKRTKLISSDTSFTVRDYSDTVLRIIVRDSQRCHVTRTMSGESGHI